MRPLRLTLRGFGPYLEEQSVDFSDVELFAITGPTGSGKSTLLEAMAYALYGRAPRVGRGVDLRHPAAREAWVALTFALGDRVYRVERIKGRRNEARLYEGDRLVPLEKLKQVEDALQDLLGLDYEAFTRALFLPQGEFDRFLKGEARERRALLFQLFELEKLKRARTKAEEKRRALLSEKEGLEREAQGLAWATPELKEELLARLSEVNQEIPKLKEEIGEKEKALKEAEDLHALLEKRHRLLARLEALKAEGPKMERLRARLEGAQEAEKALPLWEDFCEKQAKLEGTLEEMARLEGERVRTLAELDALGFDPVALREAERALREAQGLRLLEALLRRAGPFPPHPAPRFDPQGLERLLEEEGLLQKELGALSLWVQVQDHLQEKEAELKALEAEEEGLRARGQAVREAWEALGKAYRAAQAWTLQARLEALEGEVWGLEALLKEKEEALGAIQEEERRLGLLAYRDLLRVGEPCPLCGGVVHALPEAHKSLSDPRAKAGLEREVRELTQKLALKEVEGKRLREELQTLGVEPAPGDVQALKAELEAQERALQELREAYREVQGRRKAVEKEVARLKEEEARRRLAGVQDPRARLEALRERDKALQEEKAALASGLKAHLEEATGGKGVEAHLKALEKQYEALKELEERFQKLSQKLQGLEGDLKALAARKEEQEKALREAEARTQGLMPYEEAKDQALSPEERQALEGRLKAYEEELRQVEEALRALPPLPEPAPTLEEVRERVQALKGTLSGLKEKLEELTREGGRLEERLKALEEAEARRREVEGRLAWLVGELDLWAKLAQDLQEDNFPAHLLGQRQEALLARANELLSALSGDRYRLLPKADDYLILDRWAEAERPVRTLSGGESFLASLALALALSEELSKGRLGAFFLDEGFGTLDGETLEMAAGVLEALPTQGRLVGIVTHVEALAERLPARLRVRKTPKGSWVEWA